MRRTPRRNGRGKGANQLRLSTLEKAVLIGAELAFVVISYFFVP